MSAEPLFALLEVMLNLTTPKVTPGGYSEDMFVDITDQEHEDLFCTICYQLLRETRQCINRHKFCYNCIFVWSTSGPTSNHGRCPVCRVEGVYLRNKALDDRIQNKLVKCTLKTCDWIGPLRNRGSHKHETYDKLNNNPKCSEKGPTHLPVVNSNEKNRKKTPVQHHKNISQIGRRTRQRTQVRTQPVSQFSRTWFQTKTSEESNALPVTPRTPRPPMTPCPVDSSRRRRPTLPSMVNPQQENQQNEDVRISPQNSTSTMGTTNTTSSPPNNYNTIESRLRHSRDRLNSIMLVFTAELERGRQEIANFQEEREQRRQAQLDEVRDLGQRLGHVATELRRLLSERHNIRNDLNELSDG